MKSAQLLGQDHQRIGAVGAIAEGSASITLCRGGAAKTYGYTDPNEDAACFALGDGGMLAAVADGHFGARGAACAIDWLVAHCAPSWTALSPPETTPEDWCIAAARALQDVHDAVVLQGKETRLAPAPTTLSFVLARSAEDLLLYASVGDSHVFLTTAHDARDTGWGTRARVGTFYLGDSRERMRSRQRANSPEPKNSPERKDSPERKNRGGGTGDGEPSVITKETSVIGVESLAGIHAVVLATDGLSEDGIGLVDPAAAVVAAVASAAASDPDLRALEASRTVTEAALAAHRKHRSGDNIATAVLWLRG